jgi:hypothetical protein
MPNAFAVHIGTLCVTTDRNVHKMGAKIGIEPMELLSMINGKTSITKAPLVGLAKELGFDLNYLEIRDRTGAIKFLAEYLTHVDIGSQ